MDNISDSRLYCDKCLKESVETSTNLKDNE